MWFSLRDNKLSSFVIIRVVVIITAWIDILQEIIHKTAQQNSRQHGTTINVKNFLKRSKFSSNSRRKKMWNNLIYSKCVNAIYQKHIFWKISNLYKLCIGWDIIFIFLFLLFPCLRFPSNICLDYKKPEENFLFKFDLWNCLNKSFVCSRNIPSGKISFNSNFKHHIRKQLLRIGCVPCIRIWKSYDGVNRFSFTEFCYKHIQVRIFEIVIRIRTISI